MIRIIIIYIHLMNLPIFIDMTDSAQKLNIHFGIDIVAMHKNTRLSYKLYEQQVNSFHYNQ